MRAQRSTRRRLEPDCASDRPSAHEIAESGHSVSGMQRASNRVPDHVGPRISSQVTVAFVRSGRICVPRVLSSRLDDEPPYNPPNPHPTPSCPSSAPSSGASCEAKVRSASTVRTSATSLTSASVVRTALGVRQRGLLQPASAAVLSSPASVRLLCSYRLLVLVRHPRVRQCECCLRQ